MQEENKVGLTGLASALFGGDEEHETLSGGARQSGVRVRQLSARRQERQGGVESTIPIGGRNGGAGTH